MKWKGKIDFDVTPQVNGIDIYDEKRNLGSAVDPTVNDDTTGSYEVGSRWFNTTTDKEFVCLDATTAAAVWIETTQAGGGGGMVSGVSLNSGANINAADRSVLNFIEGSTKIDFVITDDAGGDEIDISVDVVEANLSITESQISDLQTYALDSGVVHTTGAESVAGVKTFTDTVAIDSTTSVDNLTMVKSNSSTSWSLNAGRAAFFDNWFLFKNSGDGDSFTFAVKNTGQFIGKDGSAGAPTYAFTDASNYGMSYDPGANEGLVLSTAGFARLRIEDTGELSVLGTTNYETLVTSDDDIPNKKFVDDHNWVEADITDLQAYALDSGVVHITGTESITGLKTFTTQLDVTASQASHILVVRNNTASGELICGQNDSGNSAFEINVGAGGNGLLRVMDDDVGSIEMESAIGSSYIDLTDPVGEYRIDSQDIDHHDALPADLTGAGDFVVATVDTNGVGISAALHMAADGNFDLADANSAGTMPCHALALEAGTGSLKVLLNGFIRNDTWAWTPGQSIYVSVTGGVLTATAPSGSGDQVQRVGIAWTADKVYFNPGGYTVVEVA